jgi:hypothetical protein
MPFRVQKHQCATCIYKTNTHFDLERLEAAIADPALPGFFAGHRICHHSDDVCCAGFWRRHKDAFTLGQLAQRLGCVEYVQVDTLHERSKRR